MDEAFVYLWQDAREKPYKYYLGYHKGTPDDGYTHSSKVFESFSKDNIPNGVRRRILATGSTEEMMELENKLLNNRKDSKWDRYYNVISHFPPYMWEDPEYRKMMSEQASNQMKTQWQDPEFREKMVKQLEDPEFRKMKSERMYELSKKQWQDPEYRKMKTKQVSEYMKKKWKDPEFRKMKSKQAKKRWEDPELRKIASERMYELSKKHWQDPKYRKMQSERMSELSSKKVTCNVCGLVGTIGPISRWHNDNCKHKDTTTLENFLTD